MVFDMGFDVDMTSHVAEVKEDLEGAVARALEAIGIQCESHAKQELQNTPTRIDTGNLRNSISHIVQGDAAYVGTNVEYAIYVHEGTRKMAPNRFLKNAVVNNVDEYKAIVEQELKKG